MCIWQWQWQRVALLSVSYWSCCFIIERFRKVVCTWKVNFGRYRVFRGYSQRWDEMRWVLIPGLLNGGLSLFKFIMVSVWGTFKLYICLYVLTFNAIVYPFVFIKIYLIYVIEKVSWMAPTIFFSMFIAMWIFSIMF